MASLLGFLEKPWYGTTWLLASSVGMLHHLVDARVKWNLASLLDFQPNHQTNGSFLGGFLDTVNPKALVPAHQNVNGLPRVGFGQGFPVCFGQVVLWPIKTHWGQCGFHWTTNAAIGFLVQDGTQCLHMVLLQLAIFQHLVQGNQVTRQELATGCQLGFQVGHQTFCQLWPFLDQVLSMVKLFHQTLDTEAGHGYYQCNGRICCGYRLKARIAT